MENVSKFQQQCLSQIIASHGRKLTKEVQDAFLNTPRHLFVDRYRVAGNKTWHQINEENVDDHLPILYKDTSLILVGDEDDNVQSSISQPSLVLNMLDLLNIKPGDKVLELGTASGWNAALMSALVGPTGHVYTVEILPEMADRSERYFADRDIKNVTVIKGDGGLGYAPEAPYDKVIFTAGCYDFPKTFFNQVKTGGSMIVVLKGKDGSDFLFDLRKEADHFTSGRAVKCGFLPVVGEYECEEQKPVTVNKLEFWSEIEMQKDVFPFWWGFGALSSGQFGLLLSGIRSFLEIVEPDYVAFEDPADRRSLLFGICDRKEKSIVIVKNRALVSFGNDRAKKKLLSALHRWIDLGMPTAVNFELKIYPGEVTISAGENEWLRRKADSQFLWRYDIKRLANILKSGT
jgi:protein-L-isoaspartate(D-aspartate) O-methyltransferase